MVKPVALMRLTQIDDPDELLKEHGRDDLVVEEKLDGWKGQVVKEGGKVRLYSRRGQEVTGNFSEIAEALSGLPDGTLAEGELVYWQDGKQDIGKMTSLANSLPEKSRKLAKDLPGEVRLHLYDILWKGGKDISGKPFSERRKALQEAVKPSGGIQLTKEYPFSSWQEAMKKAVGSGGEGIVIKLKSAGYEWKPSGQREPKPSGKMWKYKGGAGKSDSDDYVVYDWKEGDKGKLKALFGQYYKGKLYHISEISNFSEENEKEIKKRLEKGPFVVEIVFQERVPKGLRHQKFERFRDDKKPKDATMNEFHAEHIEEFEPAPAKADDGIRSTAAQRATPEAVIRLLERSLGIANLSGTRDYSILRPVPGIDIRKAYHVISGLESGRRFVVGDSGTSFGTIQLQFGSFANGLARDPQVAAVSGFTPSELRKLAASWLRAVRKMRKVDLWKSAPVDEDAVRRTMKNPRKVWRYAGRVWIRHDPGGQPGVVKLQNGRFVGRVLDLDALRRIGLDVDSPQVMAQLHRITGRYVTGAVVRNAISRLLVSRMIPETYKRFMSTFTFRNVNSNKPLAALAERVTMRNFAWRVKAVMDAVAKCGYDTSRPDAFNPYQLVALANANGYGRVRQFLCRRKLFGAGNLAYLRRANPAFTKAGIPSRMPPNGGVGGFPARTASLMAWADETQVDPMAGTAGAIRDMMDRYLDRDELREEYETSPVAYMSLNTTNPLLTVVLQPQVDLDKVIPLLPDQVRGIPVRYDSPKKQPKDDEPRLPGPHSTLEEKERFRRKPTAEIPVAEISPLPLKYEPVWREFLALKEQLDDEQAADWVVQRHPLEAGEMGVSPQQLKDVLLKKAPAIRRTAAWMKPSTLAFPGHFAEDIKSGKKEVTIRPGDMPVRVDEVVDAVTYSGAPIARIRIVSKETMSLKRLEKAFGRRCAQSLERRFGAHRRFVVIRFELFTANEADDGDDEKKMSEVLIDADKTLTRGQIVAHYSKPSVRKAIMSRIKGKPVLVYIGTGKNQKILKRNHDGKPIVITSDDEGGKDSPSNYWYWVKRRILSFHEVFGTKTDLGFVDLDLHGSYPLAKAKEYAAKLGPAIKKEFGAKTTVYQSGGTGLHVEFKLPEKTSIDKLRKRLKEMLDELNEDFEGATTGIVKGKGMRTDVSTLHNKGSLRVPGSFGESQGNVKRKISAVRGQDQDQDTDDDYGNNSWGGKHGTDGPEESGREGAFALRPPSSVEPVSDRGGWHAADDEPRWWESEGDGVAAFAARRQLFRDIAEENA